MTPNIASRNVSVLVGNGDGTFKTHRLFASGTGAFSVRATDLNNDGALDLITPNNTSNNVSLLFSKP